MDDELGLLLAAGERAAFHGRPASGVAPLQKAVELARSTERDAEATAAAWLLGVALSSAGLYGSALTVLEPIAGHGEDAAPERALFAALACTTIASVHRQLGRHEAARLKDQEALRLAGDSPEALFDARLGLAADAVGLDDPLTSRAELERAEAIAEGRSDWWRQRVRVLWVRAELALLTGDPATAATAAEDAVTLAEASGAPRHVAKSLLFHGVAQVQNGDLEDAGTTLRRAATLAESLGTLPLLWPSRAVLGALVEPNAPQESARSLASARNAVLQIADDLPEDLRATWLARPDVAALLGG